MGFMLDNKVRCEVRTNYRKTLDNRLKNETLFIRGNRKHKILEEESHLLRVHCAAWLSMGRMERDMEESLAGTPAQGREGLP